MFCRRSFPRMRPGSAGDLFTASRREASTGGTISNRSRANFRSFVLRAPARSPASKAESITYIANGVSRGIWQGHPANDARLSTAPHILKFKGQIQNATLLNRTLQKLSFILTLDLIIRYCNRRFQKLTQTLSTISFSIPAKQDTGKYETISSLRVSISPPPGRT